MTVARRNVWLFDDEALAIFTQPSVDKCWKGIVNVTTLFKIWECNKS